MEIVTMKKRMVPPLPFAKVSVQKIREMDTKRVDLQKVSVSAPIIQNCVHEVVKKSRLFPAFLCFKNRLQCPVYTHTQRPYLNNFDALGVLVMS